jgi:RNA polymerase sigma-70 factor, ECF subfamily
MEKLSAFSSVQEFEELYERFKRPIMTYVHSWVQSRTVAEEITQEVFLRAYRHRDTYEPRASRSTWLWAIARNACLDYLRKKKEVSLDEGTADDESSGFSGGFSGGTSGLRVEDIESPVSTAEAALIDNAKQKAVDECMNELSATQREVLVLRTVSEMAYEEIAEAVNASLASVKSLLFRAKQRLLDCIRRGGHADV